MSDPAWQARVTGAAGPSRIPGAGWIIGASCWLIPVLFFGGGGAWLGFLLVGAMLLRVQWLVAAGVYAIWGIVGVALPDDRTRLIVIGALQVVSIIHAMFANRRFLVTVWGRLERGEQWWGRGAPGAAGSARRRGRQPLDRLPAAQPTRRRRRQAEVPREAEALLAVAGTDRADYFADAPITAEETPPAPTGSRRRGDPPPPRGSRRRGAAPAESSAPAAPAPESTATVDVNTASEEEFRTLNGFSAKKAREAVAARNRRGRFSSVQEFADDLGLQPHQLVALRDRLTCSRPRRTSYGRRVDL